MRDEVIVYWAPSNFEIEQESWNMLYSDPKNLYEDIIAKTKKDSPIQKCPALRDLNKNVFAFHSAISDSAIFPDGFLQNVNKNFAENQQLPLDSKIALVKIRDSQYEEYINLAYNMRWIFFSEEPLIAKFTAPYFPAISPTPGALFANGKYDIGQWFRNINLDYQVPLSAKTFKISKNDALFFMEINTDKKVTFKRFTVNNVLSNIIGEVANSTSRYGYRMTLQERYEMFKQSRSRDIILREIRNNLID